MELTYYPDIPVIEQIALAVGYVTLEGSSIHIFVQIAYMELTEVLGESVACGIGQVSFHIKKK